LTTISDNLLNITSTPHRGHIAAHSKELFLNLCFR
jgi:hypothetical protein